MTKKLKPSAPVVRKRFQAYVEWNDTNHNSGAIDKRVMQLKRPQSITIIDSGLGACWDAYYLITGTTEASVRKYAGKVDRLLRRYKNIEITWS